MFAIRETGNGVAPGTARNRWTAIGHQFRILTPWGRKWLVVARCACGTIRAVEVAGLNTGNSKSCGCWKDQPENKPDGSNEPRFLPTPKQIKAWQKAQQDRWSDREHVIRSTVIPVDELTIQHARNEAAVEIACVSGLHDSERQVVDLDAEYPDLPW